MNKELNKFKSEFINYLFEKIKKLQKRNKELNDILDRLTESEINND
jgi:hypothetical protein